MTRAHRAVDPVGRFRAAGRDGRPRRSGGADLIHVDVMDGHFVPNITIGAAGGRGAEARRPRAARRASDDQRTRSLSRGVRRRRRLDHDRARSKSLPHLQRTLTRIRQLGAKAGVAINPARRSTRSAKSIGDFDILLVMSVNPGFGGQQFLPRSIDKVVAAQALLDEPPATRPTSKSMAASITTNAAELVQAGATMLVAGASIFGTPDPAGAAHALRAAALATGDPAMPTSVTTLRVRYAETDRMGVVYYANYFVWFEVARTELLRTLGWTYREMEESGVMLPVIDAHCEYRRPARYDDEVEVRTTGRLARPSAWTFDYEVVVNGQPDVVATGRTMHAATTVTGGPAACRPESGRRLHESSGHRRGRVHRLAPDSARCSTAAPRSSGSTVSPTTTRAASRSEISSRSGAAGVPVRRGHDPDRAARCAARRRDDGVSPGGAGGCAQELGRRTFASTPRTTSTRRSGCSRPSKDRRLHRFVYASSSSVYGDVATIPMREDSYLQPVSPTA